MGLGTVGGRKSPSPIDKAHGLYNSLYTVLPYKPWYSCVHFVVETDEKSSLNGGF